MITIISGTNRIGSNTKKIANIYHTILSQQGIESNLLSLDEVDIMDMIQRGDKFISIEENILKPSKKFIFIIPEYNGSFPGILKLLIDSCDVKNIFWNKSALLTGVSAGRAGNLRGLEHLTSVLLHMQVTVHWNRLPISNVTALINENNELNDKTTYTIIENHLNDFIKF